MRHPTVRSISLLVALCISASAAKAPTPLLNAHAHNDYQHERPLLDALDHGFCSVEADIYLVDGALLVAHDREDVKPDRTLQALYLDPLWKRVKQNGGKVYPDGERFFLLIDFKSEAESTYAALREALKQYEEMLTSFTPDSTTAGAVTVVISGDRPIATMAAEPARLAGVDGRLSDLEGPVNKHLMPLISESWFGNFKWSGEGEMPADVRDRLNAAVGKAHENGCLIRFWAIPARETFWKMFLDVGVDLINVDNLGRLETFLKDAKP